MIARHGTGLLHTADTQASEALNGLAVSVTPKSLCVAFGRAAPARQSATVAPFNDGLSSAVEGVLKRCGVPLGRLARGHLRAIDRIRRRHALRKGTPFGKAKRKRAATTRRAHTQADDEQNGEGEYAPGMAF